MRSQFEKQWLRKLIVPEREEASGQEVILSLNRIVVPLLKLNGTVIL